jgi:hypothetical protein
MGDIIRCEGLGSISILDLVNRLSNSEPTKPLPVINTIQPGDVHVSGIDRTEKKGRKNENRKSRFICPKEGCKRTFCSQIAVDNHMTRHARKYTCNQCDKSFSEQAKVGTGASLLFILHIYSVKTPFTGAYWRKTISMSV